MPTDDEDFDASRPISLPIFHHEKDRREVFRVPKSLKSLSKVTALYTRELLPPGNGMAILLLADDAPETKPPLPMGYVILNDYKVFIMEMNHVHGFISRFGSLIGLQESRAKLKLWERADKLLDIVEAALEEEKAKKGRTK